MESDPTYNINVSGDIKQMLAELGTEKGKQAALLGGGGSKAQQERAAALTAILDARSRIVDDSKSNGKSENREGYSIVDAASASVHGRSAAAAKAAPAEKKFASLGAKLILSARNEAELERVKNQLKGKHAPNEGKILPLDLSSGEDSLREAVERAEAFFPGFGVDYMIHNAAYERPVCKLPTLML
ncbi:hypothetical protein BVRB_1g020660 [Beta vulgaris subsp. vulgaris]|uniref:Uncharacterized protein n=1 Tax=Beta vulgaris subsp. vulgaris TaxID=3555 RepID=A0A0J8BI54_BETVV|nr:hypothetical protein BVRB_1g020660 [Beta vulgaris subsp. vulgaris]